MIGCALSHMSCVKDANNKGYKRILIVEDDIKFVDDLNQKFEEYYLEVPKSWQLLYAGGNHLGAHNVRSVSSHCIRILNTYTTHFIGMDASIYPIMLNRVPNNINNPIDVIYAEWQRHVEAYCMIPHLAWQRESFSDIDGMMANYDSIIKNFQIN